MNIKRIELERLIFYNREHLFILSGCKEGIVERLVLKELESEALKYIALFKRCLKIIIIFVFKIQYIKNVKSIFKLDV